MSLGRTEWSESTNRNTAWSPPKEDSCRMAVGKRKGRKGNWNRKYWQSVTEEGKTWRRVKMKQITSGICKKGV